MPETDENQLFLEIADMPIGWEPLAECGIDRGEAVRLCIRLRTGGRDAGITVKDGWHVVWSCTFRSWPFR